MALGSAEIGGVVDGDVWVWEDVTLDHTAYVDGDVTLAVGQVVQLPGAEVTGTINRIRGEVEEGAVEEIPAGEPEASETTTADAGLSIAAMVEEDSALKTYQLPAQVMRRYYGCDIYTGASVHAILGEDRVEGIELRRNGDEQAFRIDCDTVILTGKFRPESQLIDGTPITRDPCTQGPLIDMNFMTSVPGIFAAGNILRGAQMHDLCALEGKAAARGILKRLQASEPATAEGISIRAEAPIRYIVPQKISPVTAKPHFFPRLYPGHSLQLENTVNHPVLEAWSGNEILYRE